MLHVCLILFTYTMFKDRAGIYFMSVIRASVLSFPGQVTVSFNNLFLCVDAPTCLALVLI